MGKCEECGERAGNAIADKCGGSIEMQQTIILYIETKYDGNSHIVYELYQGQFIMYNHLSLIKRSVVTAKQMASDPAIPDTTPNPANDTFND